MLFNVNKDLFINILTSLRNISDFKWSLKSLSTEQCTLKSQNTYLSNYEKKKILEQNIKLSIQKVCHNMLNIILLFLYTAFHERLSEIAHKEQFDGVVMSSYPLLPLSD